MTRILGNFAPYFFALLRIVSGLLFAMHGTQKLLGWPGDGTSMPLASMMGFAGVVELVGGLMIAFGLFTGIAAFIACGQMAAAFFMAHFPKGPIPLLNQGELAMLYCFLFLYIAAHGAGIWSLDALRKPKPVVTY
ncbi:DoxX family protein [Adhaeribacter swui]|uniref:DoxX family protein n=1 Tax=Adhaeribacter swui TaxID=2086471 RepID=A0A7G7G346_9BACT|nr:DoxX family protein [Adhaeribacter swui]QNF31580.1 DoxX family protein [Adhaeribacter swui]